MTIKLHEKSLDYLKTVFEEYKEVKDRPVKLTGRTLIHLYPSRDTYNEQGVLDGFQDALLMDVHIYDTNNMFVYKHKCYHDQVELEVNADIRLFKDGSTILIIDKPITIGQGQSFTISEI